MIELSDISAGYGKEDVLHSISLRIDKNQFAAIIGKNSSGKTTLLKTALGIIKHNRGNICIDGKNISSMTQNDIARKISYLPQIKKVPDMTVEELVLHGRFPLTKFPHVYTEDDKNTVISAMRILGVEGISEEKISDLSGGTIQKVYIAMSLAQETDYIFLDEPTTFLDMPSKLQILRLLNELAKHSKGVVAVMHDIDLALRYADRIVVVDRGKVYFVGTPAETLDSAIIPKIFGIYISKNEMDEYFYLTRRNNEKT